MYSKYKYVCLLFLSLAFQFGQTQNETKKWYFGWGAALDFVTSPPTNISGTAWSANTSFASIANANGNLMFYTNGVTIWTNTHTVMANGTGLLGTGGSGGGGNAVLIIQKPAAPNLYYVFTIRAVGSTTPNADGLYYSIVDMNLAAGQGSVTVKNTLVYLGSLCRKLSGTRHCNGSDFWIVTKDCSNTNTNIWSGIYSFRAFQFSASGLNTNASVSTFTYNFPSNYANSTKSGQMKISPSGKRLACANYGFSLSYNPAVASIEIYDFNNTTGQVSNFFPLFTTPVGSFSVNGSAFGVEFSADASKLYGTMSNNSYYAEGSLLEWDLCQSSNTAIASSSLAVATPTNAINGFGCLQLAANGKIYVAPYNFSNTALSVINSPDQYGSAVNFSLSNISILPGGMGYYLPNFLSSTFFLSGSVPAFSLSLVSTTTGCQQLQFQTPLLLGASVGTCPANSYTLQALQWDFGDPITGSGNYSTLQNPTHVFSGTGIFNIKLTLDFGCGGQHVITQTISAGGGVGPAGGPGNLFSTGTLACNGINTGTASYSGQPNPNLNYIWTNGTATYSTPSVNNLSAGSWTSVVTNTLTTCVFTAVFSIQQPLALTITPVPSPLCLNSSLTVNAGGGTSPYSYLWSNGATAASTTCNLSGPNSVTVSDGNGCSTSTNFTVLPPVVLAASGASICTGKSATLNVVGVNNYTWWAGSVVSPTTTTSYSLTGETGGCYKDTLVTVTVYSLPTVTINSNTLSVCKNTTLALNATGALSYTWSTNTSGSVLIYSNPMVGLYTVSVKGTDANLCSGTATVQVMVTNCFTGIHDNFVESEIKVFPIPSNGDVYLRAKEGHVSLFNSVGELLWSKDVSECGHFYISSPGIYFLRMEIDSTSVMYKLIVL